MVEPDEAVQQVSGDPREETKVNVRVIRLPGERLGEAAGLLARCFHANANFADLFPADGARSRTLPRMFAAGLRDALGFGHVYATTRKAWNSTEEELAGVAVWLPPGAFSALGGTAASRPAGHGQSAGRCPALGAPAPQVHGGYSQATSRQPNWTMIRHPVLGETCHEAGYN
jgi:hypothetical protein